MLGIIYFRYVQIQYICSIDNTTSDHLASVMFVINAAELIVQLNVVSADFISHSVALDD